MPTFELLCKFLPADLEAKSKELAEAVVAYYQTEDEKRSSSKLYADELKALRGVQRRLAKELSIGGEIRAVDCDVRLNTPVAGTKQVIRRDTCELVREEAMTSEEHQESLFVDNMTAQYGEGAPPAPPPALCEICASPLKSNGACSIPQCPNSVLDSQVLPPRDDAGGEASPSA